MGIDMWILFVIVNPLSGMIFGDDNVTTELFIYRGHEICDDQ